MNEQTKLRAQKLIENRDHVKSVFSWDSGLLHLACAGIYTVKDKTVDEKVLKYCKGLLKNRVGAFSNFRGTARIPIAAMLAVSENPEKELENALKMHDLLKKYFWASTYLPLAALILTEMASEDEYDKIAVRTRIIYERMKAEHPFLTSGEDSAFCALMALSDKSDDMLIQEAESCYHILKENFFSLNAVQSLSHVLALCDGNAELKCQRTMELFTRLKEAGYKYGTSYELPTLGILSMSKADSCEIVRDMIEVDDWLSNQKGFGFLGSVSKKQRLMYAGILVQKDYFSEETMQTAAVNGTISLLVVQEAAMCAAVAASSAAASSGASSN